MKREELEKIKEILINWRKEILASQQQAVKEISEDMEDRTFSDPTDRASYEEDRAVLLKIKNRESKLLLKIDETLKRIESGDYGICDECGAEIPFERLLARPVTNLCIDCKTDQEEKETK
ncbi:MAG: RNA polymerase-binding protein DksA [Proteobacteria bacterium]|nr:RNA polymerase-binding protein DksA [Pseudomonadota bacterium]